VARSRLACKSAANSSSDAERSQSAREVAGITVEDTALTIGDLRC
jgi:hypothetical protein